MRRNQTYSFNWRLEIVNWNWSSFQTCFNGFPATVQNDQHAESKLFIYTLFRSASNVKYLASNHPQARILSNERTVAIKRVSEFQTACPTTSQHPTLAVIALNQGDSNVDSCAALDGSH